MQERLLKSFSGRSNCKVELFCLATGEKIVRKTSGEPSYDIRLLKQCTKQKMFNKLGISTPAVKQSGFAENGRYFFDMEFLEGELLSMALFNFTLEQEDALLKEFFSRVDSFKGSACPKSNRIFRNKLDELAQKVNGNRDLMATINQLKAFDFSKVPHTLCAGDQTLENVIISGNKVCVIDLLDSFFSSWLIDVAKLRQDTLLKWSYRQSTLTEDEKSRLQSVDDKLMVELRRRDPSGYLELACLNILKLNILRIIPYCKIDEFDYVFCKDALKELSN